MTTVGILGAGKLGLVLARLVSTAGYRTLIAGSGAPEDIRLIVGVLAPDAVSRSSAEVAEESDIVILAIPLSRYREVPLAALRGKTVVDAMNYWPETDGTIPEFEDSVVSSIVVSRAMPEVRLVRALSHLGYHQLDEDSRPSGAVDRHAVAIAGDVRDAAAEVAELVDSIGFDPMFIGGLAESAALAPGGPGFGVSATYDELARILRPDSSDSAEADFACSLRARHP